MWEYNRKVIVPIKYESTKKRLYKIDGFLIERNQELKYTILKYFFILN